MNAEEKLTLIDWCRDRSAMQSLTSKVQPLKLLRHQDGSGLRAIWRPISIAERAYSLSAEVHESGELEAITFRNLKTDASLELTHRRSSERLKVLASVTRSLVA